MHLHIPTQVALQVTLQGEAGVGCKQRASWSETVLKEQTLPKLPPPPRLSLCASLHSADSSGLRIMSASFRKGEMYPYTWETPALFLSGVYCQGQGEVRVKSEAWVLDEVRAWADLD